MSNNKSTAELWGVAHKLGTWGTDHDFPTSNAIAFNRYHVQPYSKEINNEKINFLDIGCGSGANTIYFAGFGYNVSAIDCSAEAVQKTIDLTKQVGVDVNVKVADFRDMPFDDNSFDAILSDGVFYYGDEASFITAIKEVYRVLKVNGILRVYTKSNRDFMTIKSNKVSSNTYLIKSGYEKGMTVCCAPKFFILDTFSPFKSIKIGIEEFNYINTSDLKSFWVITVEK
jgi:ubiquinone/menaquinone biosynthesis C-methylase UbiE